MNCPNCHKTMRIKKEDRSLGANKKEYMRTIYWCEVDDVWINVEIPKDNTQKLA